MNGFDLYFYHLVNGLAGRNVVLDDVMIFFAKYALELYVVLFLAAWFALPKRDVKNRHALVIAGLSGVLALLINLVIAHVWFRPRPFTVLPKGSFHLLVQHAPDASFPSDHVSGSFGFAAASWGKNRRWISWSFTTIAVIVMFARVFVGVHYPTDVLAGLVVGTFSGRLMWKFSRYIYPVSRTVARWFGFTTETISQGHPHNDSF